MSEVQYFLTDAVIDENEKDIPVSHAIRVVFASHFDRVTAERDALQKRLTAADERNDNRDSEIFKQVQSALRRSFSLGQIYWQQADSDSTCQQNNSDQTMEVQEQHILNVLKSLDAALKPAEVERQALELEGGHFEGHFPPGACMALPLGSTFTIIPADNGNKMCDCNQGRLACNGQCRPAEGGGDHVKHYECIGKGGDYTVVAIAQGAGTLKGFNHYVYKNADGVHFVRDPEDFLSRMQIKP